MIDQIPVGLLAPSGLLAFTIFLILTGRLVPRSTYKDALEERDKWHKAADMSEHARDLEAEANRELLELARTTVALLRALPVDRRPKQ